MKGGENVGSDKKLSKRLLLLQSLQSAVKDSVIALDRTYTFTQNKQQALEVEKINQAIFSCYFSKPISGELLNKALETTRKMVKDVRNQSFTRNLFNTSSIQYRLLETAWGDLAECLYKVVGLADMCGVSVDSPELEHALGVAIGDLDFIEGEVGKE